MESGNEQRQASTFHGFQSEQYRTRESWRRELNPATCLHGLLQPSRVVHGPRLVPTSSSLTTSPADAFPLLYHGLHATSAMHTVPHGEGGGDALSLPCCIMPSRPQLLATEEEEDFRNVEKWDKGAGAPSSTIVLSLDRRGGWVMHAVITCMGPAPLPHPLTWHP